jgi:aminopeptidase N
MKKIFFLCLIISFLEGMAQSDIDVLHYTFRIEVNDNNDTIYGEASIKFIRPKGAKTIEFDLIASSSKGKGMVVRSVSHLEGLAGEAITKEGRFTQSNRKIIITADEKSFRNDTGFYIINYKGIPDDGLIISRNKYGKRTFFADNWPNRGHNWLPCHDDPADKAPVDFIVTAPQHYQVVANGIQVEESNLPGYKKRTHWKEEVPISTKVMVIGVAEFAMSLSGNINNCIPVYSWVYPEDREKGFYDYSLAAEILPWFIKQVSPYGYKKLANVQSKTTFGGLENANTIFYSESSVTGTRKSEALLAHEIAHQWFGNMATEKTFAHLWLSEGFATYMTILYMGSKYGKDTAIAMLKEDREQVIAFGRSNKQPVVNETHDYMSLLNPNSYQKGGWILHMLRSDLGDSIFWKSIRKYYSTYGGKIAGSDDLRKVFEEVSGKNLETFFQQWLYRAGIPQLDIIWKAVDKEKMIITVEQLQDSAFTFPLSLLMGNRGKTKTYNISKKKETFEIPFDSPGLAEIIIDPSTALLFDYKIRQVK